MNQYFTPTVSARRVTGEVPATDYNPRLRFEGSLPPDIELIRRNVRFESTVPVRRIVAGESLNTRAGELTMVETTRRNAQQGAQKTQTLVVDDGTGNRLIVAGEATSEATEQAASETSVENTGTVEAQSMSQQQEAKVTAAPVDFAQTTNQTVEVYETPIGEINQFDYLLAQAQRSVSVGGTPVPTLAPAPETPVPAAPPTYGGYTLEEYLLLQESLT